MPSAVVVLVETSFEGCSAFGGLAGMPTSLVLSAVVLLGLHFFGEPAGSLGLVSEFDPLRGGN